MFLNQRTKRSMAVVLEISFKVSLLDQVIISRMPLSLKKLIDSDIINRYPKIHLLFNKAV